MPIHETNMILPGGFLKFKFKYCLALGLLVLGHSILSCAHKAAPLTMDRIDPSLLKASALHCNQLMLSFSEELDTLMLKLEDVRISADGESLRILALYPAQSASEVMVITETQKDKLYMISGRVVDKSGREGLFRKKFNGTLKPDTIAPWPSAYTKGSPNSSFTLVFSEPMDTNLAEFFIIPKKSFVARWLNYRSLSLVPESSADSLRMDTTYYLYLKKVADLSGNVFGPLITSIAPDTGTGHRPVTLKGKAQVNDTLLSQGLAMLERGKPVAIGLINKGEFSFAVRDSSSYLIRIIAAGYHGLDSISLTQDNLIKLEPGEYPFDSIIK